MSSNMNRQLIQSSAFIVLGIGVWLAVSDNAAFGRPSFGGSCANCHSNAQEGLMQVNNEDTTLDLGTQLDGNMRGPLKTFEASPGETVSLSMEVLNGSPDYAHSSDVAAVKMALRLGPERFYKYIRAYGFGEQTDIELPAETRGLLRSPNRWNGATI